MDTAYFLFAKYYLLFILFFFFFFSAGHCLLKFSSGLFRIEGFYARLFSKTLIGLVASVILYSAIGTSFKTINLALILLILFLLIELLIYKRKNKCPVRLTGYFEVKQITFPELLKKILPLFFMSLFIYSWFAFIVLKFSGSFNYNLNHQDLVYYSNTSMMMDVTGQENGSGISNFFGASYSGMEPYHYFELWLNALFSVTTGTVNFVSLYVFTYSLTSFMIVLGFLAMAERIAKVSVLIQFCALLFLFVGGLFFYDTSISSVYLLNFGESPMELSGEKFTIYYLFIIFSFLFFLEGYFVIALTSILSIPVISFGTLPGIIIGLILFLPVALFYKKITRAQFLRISLYIISLLIFITLLYKYSGNKDIHPYYSQSFLYYTDLNQISFCSVKIFLIELFYRVAGFPFKTLLLYAPFILLSIVIFYKKSLEVHFRSIVCLSILVYLGSLTCYGAFYKHFDGIQFYTNNFAFLNCTLTLGLILFFFAKWNVENRASFWVKRGLLICFVVLLLFKLIFAVDTFQKQLANKNIYSDEYLIEIQKVNPGSKKKSFVAALCTEENNEDLFNFDKSGINNPYLVFMPQFYPCVNISVLNFKEWDDLPEISEMQKATVEFSPFAQFVQKQKSENAFLSIEQSQVDFMKYYDIHFLIAYRNVKICEELSAKIKHTISDPLSGQRFIILQ